MKTVKLAAIHAKYLEYSTAANSYGDCFTEDAAFAHVRANVDMTIGWMVEAGKNKVDLVCTNEDFTTAGTYGRCFDYPGLSINLSKQIEPEAAEKISAVAKEYGIYIAANFYRFDRDVMYNTTTLFGRDGNEVGRYRKVHLADAERPFAAPGDDFPVFETDFGNVGISICYDMIFPETYRCLTLNGADIIVLQTQGWGAQGNSWDIPYSGEAMMKVRAIENGVYMVVAKNLFGEGGKSLILDNSGNTLAEAPGLEEQLLIAEFEPDYEMYDPYNYDNYFGNVHGTKARQLLGRMPGIYGVMTEMKPPIVASRWAGEKLCEDLAEHEAQVRQLEDLSKEELAKYHW